jgi:hydroxyacyl-ACP dehydratase HTD2-like protein with hotdog domain
MAGRIARPSLLSGTALRRSPLPALSLGVSRRWLSTVSSDSHSYSSVTPTQLSEVRQWVGRVNTATKHGTDPKAGWHFVADELVTLEPLRRLIATLCIRDQPIPQEVRRAAAQLKAAAEESRRRAPGTAGHLQRLAEQLERKSMTELMFDELSGGSWTARTSAIIMRRQESAWEVAVRRIPIAGFCPTAHWLYCQMVAPERYLSADGYDSAFDPPAPWHKRMWAGGTIEWLRPIFAADRIRAETRIKSAELKDSAASPGAPLVFVTVEHVIDRVNASTGDMQFYGFDTTMAGPGACVREEQIYAFRVDNLPADSARKPFAGALSAEPYTWTPNDITLQRFSSVTFNVRHSQPVPFALPSIY